MEVVLMFDPVSGQISFFLRGPTNVLWKKSRI